MAEWVAQVKEMQRQDPVAKEQWYAYCESFGNNIRDPAKHDPSFIQSFISQYQQGARLEYKEGQEFVKMIKLGQKKSQAWKGVWEAYCDTRKGADGKSTYDPAKHDIGFLEGFYDYIGSASQLLKASGGGGGMMMAPSMEPPAKRFKTNGGMSYAMPASNKDSLVSAIKAFQRQGEAQKAAWHSFCDANTNSMYDPGRLDESILTIFMTANGITPEPSSGGGGAWPSGNGGMSGYGSMGNYNSSGSYGSMGGGGMAGGLNKEPLVQAIKTFQRQGEAQKAAWHSFCDANTNGMYDPSRLDPGVMQMFMSANGIVAGSGPPPMHQMGGCGMSPPGGGGKKGALVFAIKGFQRQGEAAKQLWHSFCDTNTNSMYDPNRLDESILEAFASANGIAVGSAGMAMGGMGAALPSMGDPIKDGLVQAIKGFQRTGEAAKQAWHAFCDASTNSMYDPNRLDTATLQAFISANGLVPGASSPMGGPPAGFGGAPAGGAPPELVQRIKNYQREGQANKDCWHQFCDANTGGKYDPSRQSAAVLQQFIGMYGVP